jgi:MoxR-like ATPase
MFRRGRETWRLPALMFVGASNHLPEDETLRALYDRFLLRVRSGNVAEDALGAVLDAGWQLEHLSPDPASRGVTAESLRALQRAVSGVDLSGVREAYLVLIKKLRAAGFALSDRRVVKYQRAIAASALLAGRLAARASDLWVLRHTWDTEAQQEILRGMVDDVIQQHEPAVDDHPRARHGEAPDAEALATELRAISQALAAGGAVNRGALRDRLSGLASRLPWVANEVQRAALMDHGARLWASLSDGSGALPARSV